MPHCFSKRALDNYADVLIWSLAQGRKGKSGKYKAAPYENIVVRYHAAATPLAEALHRKLLERRWNVILRQLPRPAFERDFYALADDRQLSSVAPGEAEMYESLGGYIYINAPESLTHLKDIPASRMGRAAAAMKDILALRNRRGEKGLMSWVLCAYPTEELARHAGLSVDEYAAQIAKACMLNEKDPVARWTEVRRRAHEIRDWMSSLPIDTLRIESANSDLVVAQGEKRSYISFSGYNMPSFEVFTSPDWRGTKGVYFSNQKTFRGGNIAEGIRLEFRDGRAVRINAEKGEAFVRASLSVDEGACRVGEFSLTDRRFSRIDRFMANTLFDENFGGRFGNCHIALGSSYPATFAGDHSKLGAEARKRMGFNSSSIHWDLVNTEDKTVTATLRNGKKQIIYEHGEFRY